MVTTQEKAIINLVNPKITWEKLPDEFQLEEDLNLFLGVWQGQKEERTGYWLRWWDEAENLLPWAVEQIEQERQRAENERQRAEKLAAFLRSQGINPDEIS